MNKNKARVIRRPTLKKTLRKTSVISIIITMTILWLLLSVASMVTLKQYAQSNLRLSGASISQSLEAPLVFHDIQAAHDTLTTLGHRGQFYRAVLFDPGNHELTRWERKNTHDENIVERVVNSWLYPAPVPLPVQHNGVNLGSLYLTGSNSVIIHFIWLSLGVLTLCLVLASFIAVAITNRLNQGLVNTLKNMTGVVHDVRTNRNFDRRVEPDGIAEFHRFGQDLNSLLSDMESWQKQLRQRNASLRKSAMRDALTGLKNRASFNNMLTRLLNNPQQRVKTAMLFMDTDNFKQINDTWGHAAGDRVLTELAARLRSFDFTPHSVYRLGGDEFAMILPDIRREEDVQQVIQALRKHIHHPMPFKDGHYITMTLSIGFAMADLHTTPKSLMELADQRMYREKKHRHHTF